MQAIQTKYHGPTNTTGSRISARCAAGRITVHYDDALSADANHRAAARALVVKMGWTDRIFSGGTLADGSMVWVDTLETWRGDDRYLSFLVRAGDK